MFFKRSNGEFRETDRVTRFKLIKSGKNWLRASTSNFGLLKVIRGQVEETIVAEVREDAGMTGRSFLKGAAVAVAVLSLASFVNTSYADELGKDEVATSAVVNTPAVASEPAALNEQDSKEVVGTLNESATEAPASTTPSSEVVETVPASDDKTILEQNASEAALLNKIAEKYASNHQNTEQKEAINDAVAKVQSELTAGDKLTDTDATAQTYADQRERLSKSVDDMMATLTAAGFEGNTTVNGAPAISAQLDALSTSNTLTAPSVSPTMDQPNGAAIEDPEWNNANYKLDPNADRYTYSIWDLQNWAGPANQGGVTYSNGGYYVTFSVDRSTVGTTTTPVVHARLVEKTTGKEVETLDMTAKSIYQFKTLVQANPTYAPQFDYTTGEASQILGTWTNNREAGPTSDDKYKHHILQIRDTVKPGNVGETKPNVQTVVPAEKVTHTTHYKVEGTNEELASYSQTGIESQAYKASNPRSFESYEFVRTDAEKDMSGFLGGVGAKYLELQGGRAHYYVKRIIEQVDKDGTSVVKLYALDPSKVSSYNPSTDVNTLDLTNYTLLYTSDPVKPGGKPTPPGTKDATHSVGFVDSKDGQYRLKVETYTDGGNGNVRLSGWYNKATGDAFTASPQYSADVDPVRNNRDNIIGGNTPGDKASGYRSFFNNYSLPSVKQISTDVTHYYRKSEVTGNVYVHYKDTEGTTIKDSVKDEDQKPINKHYETQDNRPQTIKKDGKTYELVPAGNYKVGEVDKEGHLKSSDPTTGEVAKEDKNVTYIYKLKEAPKGNVYVHYVDTEGKTIKSDVTDEDQQPVDKDYNTVEDNRPQKIEFEGKTYELVPAGNYKVGEVDDQGHLKSTDPTTGKVIEGNKNVTYVYKLKEAPKGNVYVHYVDTEGKTIKSDVTDEDQQPVDKDYNTVEDNRPQKIEFEGKTYELVPAGNYKVGEVDDQGHLKSTDPTTGKVIEGNKNVTYVYKLKEAPKGNVYVHYVDTEGKTIKSDVTDEDQQPVDKDYNTVEDNRPQKIEFEGKTYELVPAGNYKVGEVDDQGHLKSTDPTTGKVIEGNKNVTYVYKLKEAPKGNVYVHYVDTEGKTIKSDVTDEDQQPVDKDYNTVEDNRPQKIEFEGKTYELVPAGNYKVGEVDDQGHLKSTDPTTGKVIEGNKNVTYVYKLKEAPKGNVYVHYVDTEGKTIKSDVTDEDQQPVDKDYNTVEDNRPQKIEFEGKTYELVPAGNYKVGEVDDQGHLKSTDPTTGKVIEGNKNVTYVYKLKEAPKGNVYVHYVDTEGKTIKSDVTDEDQQPVDKDYNTVEDNRPQKIEFEGKTYELVPAGNYKVGEVDDQGHLKSTDPTTGKVIEGNKNVTYVYKLKEAPKGNVYVHYVDTEGKTIKSDVTDEDQQPVDKDYNTVEDNRPQKIEFEGKTYELVPAGNYKVGEVDDQGHLKSTDPTTGKVIEGNKNVTYVYKLKEAPKGNVYVHYVDTEGKTIKSDVTDEDQQPVDKDYNTVEDNRPQKIEFEGKTYELVPAGNYKVGEVDDQGHLKSTDPTTGKVIEGNKNVTYVYKLKEAPKGNVYVHYVDTEGKTIKSDVTDEDQQPVDKDYNTVEDNRPQKIEFEGKTYELVPAGNYKVGEVDDQGHLKSTDPTTGKVIEGNKNVTYVYKLKEAPKGNVYVHYVDTEGKTIKSDVTDEDQQPVDKDYNTVEDNRPQKIEFEGKTYELVPAGNYKVGEVDDQGHLKSTDPTTGKVIEGNKNVTYVYKLKEAPKGNVYVHYVDTEGKTIKSDVTDEDQQPVDKDYNTVEDNRPQKIEFEGKTYELVPAGNYKVGEVDDQGHLKSTDPTTGKVIEGNKNVTYVYKLKEAPKGNVYVHYVDTEGKTIKSDVTDEDQQPVDKDYNTVEDNRPQKIEFEGKTYELVPAGNYKVGEVDDQGHLKSTDPTTGKVIEGNKNVTYVYKLKEAPKGNVYVHYVDTEGKTIKSDVTDEDQQPVDKDYNTVEDNRPQKIEFEGKTYELVPAGNYKVGEVDDQGHLKSTDPTTGKVIEGNKNVTYVYKLKEAPKGNVYVHYVDTEGKTIKSDVTDEDQQPVDKDYNTVEDNRPQKIEFEGKTYELVPAGNYKVGEVDDQGHLKSTDPTTGKVIEGNKNVTYVYKLKETPDKPVEPTPDKPVEPTPDKPVEPTPDKPVEPTPDKPVEPTPDKPVEPTPDKPVEPTPDKPVEPTPDKPVEPTPDKPVEPTPDKPVEPTPDKPVEPTPDKPVEPTPDKPVEPTPDKPVEPTPDKPVEPTPDKPVEPTPDKPVEPTPDKPVEPTPDKPVEPTPDKPVEPTPDKPVEPTPDKPVEPTPDKPVEPTPDKPVEPTPDKPVEPTPDKPVEPTPDKPVEPTPDKPVEPTPDKPVEPTPDKPVEPTPDKPVEPTPDKPVEPTPDKPVEPTPDKPVEPTPDKPVEPTPDKPVEPTPDKPVEPTPDKPVEPTPDKPVEPTPDKPVEPTPDKPVEPTPDKPVEPTPDKPVEPTPDKPVEPTPDKPVEPTPDKPVEPTPDKPVEPTPDKPVEPTPDKPVEPTPDKPVEPTPDKPVEPTPDKPVEPTPDKPVEPTPDKPVEPTPDKPVEPTPDKPVEPTPDKPVEPTPDKPVEPTPDKPVEPTPDKPVEPTPDKPVEPTPDKPVEPTPDKPVEPTPDKPVEPTPDKPVEPTPDKPVEPTPDKPVEPTPDKPVEPTPDKPVEPTPDKPVEPTPDKPVEPTPDKPVEPTPDKPVEPTPDKPVEPTPDKPVEPTPDKPVEPTPDKPVEPTPDKPVEPTPDKPVEPTPDKPVDPTPGKPVNPTPGKPVDPTPGKPVDPTPGKPVNPTPGKPVNPTPGKPVDPTPGKPVNPTPGKPVNPTPGKPVDPTPGKPVNPTPDKPVDPTPDKPVNPTPGKPVDPTPGKPVNPTPDKPVDPTPDKPVDPTPGKPVDPTPSKPVSEQPANPTSAKAQLPNTGETKSAGSTVLGVVAGLVGLAALGRRKKEDEK